VHEKYFLPGCSLKQSLKNYFSAQYILIASHLYSQFSDRLILVNSHSLYHSPFSNRVPVDFSLDVHPVVPKGYATHGLVPMVL
jgi:hypothetical protein